MKIKGFHQEKETAYMFLFSNFVMKHELQVVTSLRSISGKQADEKKSPTFLICINFQEDSQMPLDCWTL